MSQHDERVRLQHMRDYAAEAIQLSQGRQRSDLDSDRLYSLAMIRLVELIGEAASRITAGHSGVSISAPADSVGTDDRRAEPADSRLRPDQPGHRLGHSVAGLAAVGDRT